MRQSKDVLSTKIGFLATIALQTEIIFCPFYVEGHADYESVSYPSFGNTLACGAALCRLIQE
jgi:hypothetical protein